MLGYKQFIQFTLLASASIAAMAFPKGCEVSGFAFQDNYLVLNDNGNQTLFMIQNTGTGNLSLEHIETRADVFMSPKLESKLNTHQYSTFSSDISNFHVKCSIVDETGTATPVNCASYLSVCQYPRAQFPLSNKGNYWISTNKELTQVIQETVKKGIYLKW